MTGLTGSGLVLRLNGQGELTVTTAGAFVFPVAVQSCASYAVTVASQPKTPDQLCSVVHGAGQVGAAAIDDIQVTCVPAVSIGGAVVGLQGAGLVLQLDGQSDLPLSTAGNFTFGAKLESGSTYHVSVAQQPTNPWQDCTVTNGTGTATRDVLNVAVTCTTNTYSVGCDVAGVKGAGLVLRLEGHGEVTVTADGTVTFPSKILSGAGFAVTVGAQPSRPTQTCLVAGGTGAVTSANVTVKVSCTTNNYAVGGTVQGLSGAGLVLRLNGQTSLPVATNGAYSFPGKLASGASYTVVVATQPASPTQLCTPSGGSGTVGASDVSVPVSCANVPPTLVGPLDQTVYPGVSATFSAVASGNGPFTYQWRRNGVVLPGAISASYTTPLAKAADDGAKLSVDVADAYGGAASGSALLRLKKWSGFAPCGPLALERSAHAATLLPSGKVLVTGGTTALEAELFDPETATFSMSGPMVLARSSHTATLLPSGKVLIVGGWNKFDGGRSSAELYDPALGTFTAAGDLTDGPRYDHTATLLPNGKVLIAGGMGKDVGHLTAELYDPATGRFSKTGSMTTERWRHTATLLQNGMVLITGGSSLRSAELYNHPSTSSTGSFSTTGNMTTDRDNHVATLLADGTVLVAGGFDGTLPAPSSVELYDPAAFTFTAAGNMSTARMQAVAVRLSDGRVLIAGGVADGSAALVSADLFNPQSRAISAAGNMAVGRQLFTATALLDGRVLVVGGRNTASAETGTSAELYR